MAVSESTRPRAGGPGLEAWAWRIAPLVAAAVAAGIYLVLAPKTGDLPAHVFRAKLFGRDGLAVWNGNWYGGHHTPGYSLLFPPIAWALGPAVAGALAALAATALFEPLAHGHFGDHARWGALWFGVGTSSMLLTAQLPFVLGVAIGLGSLLALQRRHPALAIVLAVLSPLGSPVAGFFLALAALAYWLSSRSRAALFVTGAAMAPPILLALAFPEGGRQPYAFLAFIPVPVMVIVFCALLLRGERSLRIGALLYALAALAAFVVPTPMGGNASRLGAVFAGPIAASIIFGVRKPALRPWLIAVILVPLAYWQLGPAVRNVSSEHNDRFTSYYHPLLQFLEANERPAGRVEVVFTHSNWEAATVAIHFPLARGWERQLDVSRNSLFYDGTITERTYGQWLDENAVKYVALPDVPLDYSAKKEAEIVKAGPPYLALRWSSPHWKVYAVTSPHPLVVPEGNAQIVARTMAITRLRLQVNQPGSAVVRVRWTPYWVANGACVERAGDWTRVIARKPGPLLLRVRFSIDRVFEHGRRCAA